MGLFGSIFERKLSIIEVDIKLENCVKNDRMKMYLRGKNFKNRVFLAIWPLANVHRFTKKKEEKHGLLSTTRARLTQGSI